MGLEADVAECMAKGIGDFWVKTADLEALIRERDELKHQVAEYAAIRDADADIVAVLNGKMDALIREREALKAENAFLKVQIDARKVEITDLVMKSAPSGYSCSDRAIVNDRLAALEEAVKDLQFRETRLDSRLDDFIGRVDEIERSHLESAR